MYIQKCSISNYKYFNNIKKVSFSGVKEAIDVWQESKPTIEEALSVLGDKKLSVLMHGSSFPSLPEEDFSIGSPYSNGAKEVADFFGGVFSQCVLGPWGQTSKTREYSPYNSTLESRNPFFINYSYLTTNEGGRLLSRETFNDVVSNNPEKNNKVNYDYVEKSTTRMLDEAFNTHKSRLRNNNEAAIDLEFQIQKFKEENNGILLDAIYNCLAKEYQNDDYTKWDYTDSKLPILLEQNDKKAEKRLEDIIQRNEEFVEKYIFTQYLAKDHIKLAPMDYVADKQVAIGESDKWKLQDIILDNIQGREISLGVPGDAFSSKGRCWNIPVFDIKKLFNEDGSLTKGGERLYNIYRNIFRENRGGVRIDHFQGIIDPFVCVDNNADINSGAGRLLSSPGHTLFSSYSIINENNIDYSKSIYDIHRIKTLTQEQIDKYGQFFEKIILAAAKAEGMDETNIMPEDLGSITKPTVEVIAKHNLGSMKVTEFVNPEKENHIYRGKNSKPKDYITTGTHDNKPFITYFQEMPDEKYTKHIDMLVNDLGLKKAYTKKDRTYGIKLKFGELFTAPAKNVQLFFTHILGMNEWYNKPGDKTVTKWGLRMPNNFKEVYLRNMVKGLAFNPYDALSRALKSKHNPEYDSLIHNLKSYEKQIKEELDS